MPTTSQQPRQPVGDTAAAPLPRYRYVRPLWLLLATIIDAVGSRLLALARWFRTPPPPRSLDQVRRVLLVQMDHLGDALITTAILPELRRCLPAARIEVLAAPWNYEVFRHRPEVDELLVCSWNRFRRGWRMGWLLSMLSWGWALRRRRYDLAIDIRGELPLAVLIWLTGAPRRVGWPAGGGGFLLTHPVAYQPQRSEVASRWHLLHTALELPPPTELRGANFQPTGLARRVVAQQWLDLGLAGHPVVVLHVSAGTPAKQWPVEHWRELLGRLIVELDARAILVGTDADTPRARAMTEGRHWPGVFDWTGLLDLDHLAAVLERAAVFVGCDSGPAHLAAAVGRPAVVLFSGTNDWRQWQPWGDRVRALHVPVACAPCRQQTCPLADHPCMTQLSPRQVVETVVEVCRQSPRSAAGLAAELPAEARDLPRFRFGRSA